ncbi:MAG: glycosyltransferase [Verrucomicrobiota bacterium]
MPDVSIIIPNYNGSSFLREAIESALAQKGVDHEVIVVDDGSTDDSIDIIKSFDGEIRAYFHENRGAAAARNVGWRHARSDWFKFLDSDDRLVPSALRRQMERLADFKAEDRYITFTNARFVDRAGLTTLESYYPEITPDACLSAAQLVRKAPITTMPLFPRIAMEEVGGFNPDLRSADDHDLNVRLQFHGWDFVFLDFIGYEYRVYESHNRISQQRLSSIDLELRYASFLEHLELAKAELSGPKGKALAQAFADVFWSSGRLALRADKQDSATPYFRSARQLSSEVPSGAPLYQGLCRIVGPRLAEKCAGLQQRLKSF